ncbi:MAG: nidogen-like domain-containing protein [Pseudomonadota bacterium]
MTTLVNTLGGTLGFGENYVDRNDDSYKAGVSLNAIFGATGLNFFGKNYDYVSINNNGNVTFSNDPLAGLYTYTPFGLEKGGYAIIAPFFADVDTRLSGGAIGPNQVTPTPGGTSRGSDIVWYDMDTTGYGKLTVTWDDVGYYSYHTDKLNAFQLQIIGTGNGNFDMVFRYEAVNWTTGDASGGSGGLGGTVARAGYSTGDGSAWYELAQSGVQNSMLNLETTLGNTGIAGYYKFSVRSGTAAAETIKGTSHDDLLAGAGGNDIIYGYAGNDSLIGNAGADRVVGGTGNDTYTVDQYDTVVEKVGEGKDTVMSAASYTLGNYVENLQLTGTANINGTGNALNNILSGNSGNNILNGKLGIDTVDYSLASAGLTVNLGLTSSQNLTPGGQGYDTLLSFENIIGSYYDDSLTGTNGANILDGNVGADTLKGRGGNDTYIVDNTGDLVTELAGQGTDLVKSSVTEALSANVEKLTLTGTAAANGTGNGLNNVLIGNAAANKLSGVGGADTLNGGGGNDTLLGGTGKDTLTGGAGKDYFVFNTALNATTNVDTIKDFSAVADTIRLENSIFTKLVATGALGAGNYRESLTGNAVDANDFILYETDTGKLYYDADGSGAGAKVQFATVYATGTTPADLSAADFVVI